jgi:hypothetical protein
MPTKLPAEQRTRTVRAFLKLCVASSVLQCALVLSIYRFHLSGTLLYVLALIPISPLCAIVLGAMRKRAEEADPYVRKAYVRALIIPGLMTAMVPLLITLSFFSRGGIGFAISNSAFPLALGSLFAFMLLMPKRMWNGGSLGDQLLPVRNKLITPTQNRLTRTAALLFVYIIVSFANRILFDSCALTGALAYAIALLPVLPIFGLVPIYNKYMAEEQDEFQRHLFHQSILVAFFGTYVIASVMSRLQDHALISQRASDLFRHFVFYIFLWLQFEAFYVAAAIQDLRIRAHEKKEKKDQ